MNPQKYISHKQLSNAYGVHPDTLRKEIARALPGLKKRKFAKLYTIPQQKLIFSKLGNPFSETI